MKLKVVSTNNHVWQNAGSLSHYHIVASVFFYLTIFPCNYHIIDTHCCWILSELQRSKNALLWENNHTWTLKSTLGVELHVFIMCADPFAYQKKSCEDKSFVITAWPVEIIPYIYKR